MIRAPFIFSSDYKHFYCQYNEPSYVKKLKLEMLTAVANESNTYEIGKCKATQIFFFISEGLEVKKFAWENLHPVMFGGPDSGHRCFILG